MTTYYVDGAAGNDANAGTSPGSGNAWATIGKAAAAPVVAGDLVYIKASATYTLASAISFTVAGVTYRGYSATPGAEDGYPLVTTSTASTPLFAVAGAGITFRQLHLTNTSGGLRASGLYAASADRSCCRFLDLILDGFTFGIDGDFTTNFAFPSALAWRVEAKNCSTAGISFHQGTILDCYVHDNTGDGWRHGAQSGGGVAIAGSVFANNTGKNINWNIDSSGPLTIRNTAVRGAGGDGILVGASTAAVQLALENCVVENNGGYGINSSLALPYALQKNNAFRGNTTANRAANVPAGEGDITLTAEWATNAAGGNYAPNSTAGGGALLRAAGFPGAAPFGTGYGDVGPLQHQDAGGGGGATVPMPPIRSNSYVLLD